VLSRGGSWAIVRREEGGRKVAEEEKGESRRASDPFFFSFSYIGGHIAQSGVPAVAGRFPRSIPLRKEGIPGDLPPCPQDLNDL